MKNTYNDINAYAFGEHKEAFEVLLNVFQEFSLRYFLIGAQARDVHFFRQGIKPLRATRDIDFAVMVDSHNQYITLMETLASKGFSRTNFYN